MIASLKSYSRIARTLLGVLGALLIVGIIGSLLMGVRAKTTAQEMVVAQSRAIADSSLSLVFEPNDLLGPVGITRAMELTDQIQSVVVDPSDFDEVTVYSPEGTILYSTEEGRIGNELPGEKDRIKEALKDTPQVTTYQGTVSIMLPLRFRSGVGSPAVVQLTRPDTPIATAAAPWNTNAMFLFAMLVVLGLAVFGVARLLSVVANAPERAAELPRPVVTQQPARVAAPQPGMREEGEARRRAEERAAAAEERLGVLQDQYRKTLEELQAFRTRGQEARGSAAGDSKVEERALRAEGQVRTLEQQIETLRTERARLSEQLQDALRMPVEADGGRAAALEHEKEELHRQLDRTRAELTEALLRPDRSQADGTDSEIRSELDTTHVELLRTKDDLSAAGSMLDRARGELDDARTELRALRNEEQRAAMLEDELRATKAELESKNASFRADLVEREAEFEDKVRETREAFQRQLTDMQASYEAQVKQAEESLAGRITTAETTARRAAAELETARVDLDTARLDVEAARGEAASREQRLLEAHDELLATRQQLKTMQAEIKERSAAVTQAHKEVDDIRRSLVGAQADLSRTDGAVEEVRAELEQERQRAEDTDQAALTAAHERDALQERVDKLIRQLDDAAADNQEVNRRLQEIEARRQLELADDPGRSQIDELLRVTQERLAGQTEKLITAEDRTHELESELADAVKRADLAEAEIRTHQMSDALREMREHDVAATRDAATQREISAATSAAIGAGALDDRRAAGPFLKELSMDAKKSLAKIDGIAKLLKHKKDAKDQALLMKQLATHTRRLDRTVADLADADQIATGTVELTIKRTDMEALVGRVVEESGSESDHDIRIVADPLKLRIDAQRVEQILNGLLRMSTERVQNGKTIVVRLKAVEGGAMLSVEDPGSPTEHTISPVVRRFAEVQGGWIKAEAAEGGGTAFRAFLPDGAGTGTPAEAPALQITVEELDGEPEEAWEAEAAHQTLAAEIRRVAQLQTEG